MTDRKDWIIGTSIHFDEGFAEKLNEAIDAGFKSVDFDLCIYWQSPEKEAELYRHLEEGLVAVKDSGIYLNAVHISFGPRWDISKLNDSERKSIVGKIKDIFERCDLYSPYTYVIHGSYGPIDDEIRPRKIEQLKTSLSELRSYTKTHISLETMTAYALGNTADEIISIVDSISGIDICLDTNHFLQETTEDAVRKIAGRIRTIHVSDHDYVRERHWLPGEGKINWQAVIEALESVSYSGTWTYEVALNSTNGIHRQKPLTYRDLMENAKGILGR